MQNVKSTPLEKHAHVCKLLKNYREINNVSVTYSDAETQTEHSVLNFHDQGMSTAVRTENRKIQARSQVFFDVLNILLNFFC